MVPEKKYVLLGQFCIKRIYSEMLKPHKNNVVVLVCSFTKVIVDSKWRILVVV